jgi:hypothetical protein
MFRRVPLSIIRSYSLYSQQWYMSYRFTDSFRAVLWTGPVYKPVWHIPLLSVQWITPDDGQRNCPKHVEFHYKIKTFEKLVHLVGSIIRNLSRCTDTRTSNLQNDYLLLNFILLDQILYNQSAARNMLYSNFATISWPKKNCTSLHRCLCVTSDSMRTAEWIYIKFGIGCH